MKDISMEYTQQYKDFCRKVKKSARQDKEHWIHDQCEQAEKGLNVGNTRQAYSLIKMLRKEFVPRVTLGMHRARTTRVRSFPRSGGSRVRVFPGLDLKL